MARKRWLRALATLAMGGIPLTTSIECDGTSLFIYRDDDDYDCEFYDPFCYASGWVDDCWYSDCHGGDDFWYFD